MMDAPPFYLALDTQNGGDPLSGLDDETIARHIRSVMVEPLHALSKSVGVFGETYNLLRPTYNKMLDGGRNTDMAGGFKGFPGRLHALVMDQDASGLEALLRETVDVLAGWSGGGGVRTEPDSSGNATIAGMSTVVSRVVPSLFIVVFSLILWF